MVVFDNVVKTFPASWWGQTKRKDVLKGVSFEAKPGEIMGLLGANGAGKTTAFRILAGLERWDSGDVIVNGCSVQSDPQWVRQNVGILLEKHGFHKMSGRLVLEQTGLCMGFDLKQARLRTQELIDQLDMAEFVDHTADKYSRGQLGRLGIARMMVDPAPVLIFDEPTVGLDFASADRVRKYIRSCASQGHTVLLATHLLSDIKTLCDHVVGLEHGLVASPETVTQWLRSQEEVAS